MTSFTVKKWSNSDFLSVSNPLYTVYQPNMFLVYMCGVWNRAIHLTHLVNRYDCLTVFLLLREVAGPKKEKFYRIARPNFKLALGYSHVTGHLFANL